MGNPAGLDQRLQATDVTERAAAVRELEAGGDFDDALRLIDVAMSDRSPSVRLHAAGAAAQVATRVRPTAEQQAILLDRLRALEPGFNPSLLLLFACAADAGGIERIGRMLRDPRSDVRAGAVAALKRLVLDGHSAAAPAVRAWLEAGKHPADVVGEMIRMASEAGWPEMDGVIQQAASRGRTAAVAAQEALEWSAARKDPNSWVGLWVELDADEAVVVDWLYLEGGQVWGPHGGPRPLAVVDGVGAVEGRPPLVRMRLGRASDDGPSEALALGEHKLWRQHPRLVAKRLDAIESIFVACTPAALGCARELLPLEGAGALRARAVALWRGGALKDADRLLTSLSAPDRKPKPDLLWIHANVKRDMGDADAARATLEVCLKAAPKKASWRPAAEALLQDLG